MEKLSGASKSMKLMYSILTIIIILVGFVVYSILGAQDVMIHNTKDFLIEQSSNFGQDVEKEFYSFESDVTYTVGHGSFSGFLKNVPVVEHERKDLIRLYARHSALIESMDIYDKTSMRSVDFSNEHYFEAGKATKPLKGFILTSSRRLVTIDGRLYMLVPIYNDLNFLMGGVAIGLNLDGFLSDIGKSHSAGEGVEKWYMDNSGGIVLIGNSTGSYKDFMPSDVALVMKEKLNYGFRDLIFHKAKIDHIDQSVISCMYPIVLGDLHLAVGFTVLESSILENIRFKIIQISLLFTTILLLICYIFFVFLRVEIKAKRELAIARESVSRVLDNLPTGVILYHESDEIIRVNQAAVALLGLENEHISHGNSVNKYIVSIKDESGAVRRYIKRGIHHIPVISDIIEMEMAGQNVSVMTFADISEIEQARKLAEDSSRIKSEFIANMSHEIRTPMNGVIASVQILEEMNLNEEQSEFVGIIKKSAANLMVIINDILDISKIESGKMTLECIPFNIRNEFGLVAGQFASKAQSKGLELVLDIDFAVPELIMGDPIRLTQIVGNMLGNAVKFTEEGTLALMVRVKKAFDNQVRLSIEIGDTGIGIPKEKQNMIFEAFTQVDGSITRKYGGTGLGTSISRELVELMSGVIWVESPNPLFGEGQGSVFHIEIDFQVASLQPELPQATAIKKSLLVDRNKVSLEAISRLLESFGVEVTAVTNTQDAVKAVVKAYESKQRFDCVFCDYKTSVDGENLFEILKKIDGRGDEDDNLDHVHALVQMGDMTQLEMVKRFDVAYLVKPVKWADVYEILQN